MTDRDTDLQKIEELIEVMKENDLVEVEIKHGDDKILLKRSSSGVQNITTVPFISHGVPAGRVDSGPAQPGAQGQAEPTEAKDENLIEIKAPMVGTFYATPSPDLDSYVEIDSHVNSQSVVCIIEAMKVMNEIKAEIDGTIVEILAKNGQAVEYGQVLFKVRPD